MNPTDTPTKNPTRKPTLNPTDNPTIEFVPTTSEPTESPTILIENDAVDENNEAISGTGLGYLVAALFLAVMFSISLIILVKKMNTLHEMNKRHNKVFGFAF